MDINDIHLFLQLLENKDVNSYHTPADRDNALHRSQMDVFWKIAPVYGEDAETKAAGDPFQQSYMVTPANSPGGLVTLPSKQAFPSKLNFGRLLSAMAVSYDNKQMKAVYFDIDLVNNDELAKRLMSQLKPVTYDRPVATSDNDGVYQLYPQLPNTAMFTYLALPVKPVWGHTQQGRAITYDPTTSTQLQWNEAYLTKIIDGAIVYLGLNTGDTTLVQFMAQKSAS